VALSVALMIAIAGCSDSNVIGPDNQLEVTNAQDNFQLQVSALDGVTQTLEYTWQNTGTQATIDVSEAITSGTAILTITDAAGTVVYQEDLADDSDGQTTVGVAGGWGIGVVLDGVNGTFNFRVQRTT
jgi:flagellar hook assembly protein FlgD